MSESDPILGEITFERDGVTHAVRLHDTGAWTVEPPITDGTWPIFRSVLDDIVAEYTGPSCGFFGPPQLRKAAQFLKGQLAKERETKDPGPGVIY